jgi:hypothetical protein
MILVRASWPNFNLILRDLAARVLIEIGYSRTRVLD